MEVIALILIFFGAIIFQGMLFNKKVFKNLDYQCEFSVKEAHEGDDIFLVETIKNKKLLPVPWLKVEIQSSRWLDYAGTRSVVAQDKRHVTSSFLLKSFQKTTRRWKLKCLKRGVFTIENTTLVSGDPLGIYTPSIASNVNATLVVYPEIIDFEEMFIPTNFLQGNTIVRRWIIDDPFIVSGAREYTPQDSMNRIHWGATAREGRLMVKKNDFTSELSLSVLLNMQSMENEYEYVVDKNIAEFGIKVAATIFDKCLKMGMPVRFGTNGYTSDEKGKSILTGESAGRDHISDLLKILAKLELRSAKDFEDYLKEVVDSVTGTDIILVTAYITENMCNIIRDLSRKNNAVKVLVLDKYAESANIPGDIDIYFLSGDDKINEGNN